jgi:hypothetical protein
MNENIICSVSVHIAWMIIILDSYQLMPFFSHLHIKILSGQWRELEGRDSADDQMMIMTTTTTYVALEDFIETLVLLFLRTRRLELRPCICAVWSMNTNTVHCTAKKCEEGRTREFDDFPGTFLRTQTCRNS